MLHMSMSRLLSGLENRATAACPPTTDSQKPCPDALILPACCRGWRRSGRWVYFPLHERSCCQLLTIRLDVTRFAPNKEQVCWAEQAAEAGRDDDARQALAPAHLRAAHCVALNLAPCLTVRCVSLD